MHDMRPPSVVASFRTHRARLAIIVVILLVAACGTSTSETSAITSTAPPAADRTTTSTVTTTTALPTTTSLPTTTTSTTLPPPAPGLDEAFLTEQLALLPIPEGEGAALAVVIDADGVVLHAATGADHDGNGPTPDDTFRVGSITKLFTALVTLQLVDEGRVDLDAPVNQYVTRVNVPDAVRVRHLLHHSSGVHDYIMALAYQDQEGDPQRVWTPEEAFEIVEDRRLLFEPGSTYRYSNSNYLILGILIEEVTDTEFHAALRSRIIEPLRLDRTYLAGVEDGPAPFLGYYWTELRGPVAPADFDYTSVATASWAAGAMVTTAADLHQLLSALFDGRIVGPASLQVMTGTDDEFSVFDPLGYEGLHVHGGHFPGYQSLVAHAPDLGATVFFVMTNDRLYGSFEAAALRILDELESAASP